MNAITEEDIGKTDSAKTPLARLLDMLAGWSEYVQIEEDAVLDKQVSIEELCDLYQEAGKLMGGNQTPDEEEVAVRSFVEMQLTPILLRK